MPAYYPPVGFHFRVDILDVQANANDIRFTEVSGLSAEVATEEVAEGGENRFIQRYPTRTKYTDLVLKRGLLVDSRVMDWIHQCIDDQNVEPKNVDVKLLNENHEPLMTWHVIKAYPTKWVVSDFNANTNGVVVETLQLAYQYFTVDRG
jgi:phage tail-like protein